MLSTVAGVSMGSTRTRRPSLPPPSAWRRTSATGAPVRCQLFGYFTDRPVRSSWNVSNSDSGRVGAVADVVGVVAPAWPPLDALLVMPLLRAYAVMAVTR